MPSKMVLALSVVVVLCLSLGVNIQAIANQESETRSDSDSVVLAGRERFVDACAFCHGLAGRGNGMAASMLEKLPADLTQLSKGNDGDFPLVMIYRIIDGRTGVATHGSREMPVWGDVWAKNAPPEFAEYYVKGRILELIMFLESIQE